MLVHSSLPPSLTHSSPLPLPRHLARFPCLFVVTSAAKAAATNPTNAINAINAPDPRTSHRRTNLAPHHASFPHFSSPPCRLCCRSRCSCMQTFLIHPFFSPPSHSQPLSSIVVRSLTHFANSAMPLPRVHWLQPANRKLNTCVTENVLQTSGLRTANVPQCQNQRRD